MSLVSTNKIEENKYELEITASPEEFEAAIESAYKRARKRININGFRKGAAPRKVIERIYGENVFYEDAVNALVPIVINPAIQEAGLELIANPDINVNSLSKTAGVAFKVTALVKPDVEISDYKGIEVKKNVKEVTDEDVDKMIDALRERNGRMISVEGRAAENGDIAVIDFEGFIDGAAFDGGKEDNYELSLGSGQFIPGFEEQIVGKNAGDEFTISVTFPENYQMADVAGKPAEFKIKLNEIRTKELPDLDDEFVKDATELDTLDELKADYRKKLEETAAKEADIEADNAVFEALIDKMNANIPEIMFTNKVDEMVGDFEIRLSQQGLNLETYLAFTGMNMDTFKKTFEERADKEVKIRLALEKIAKLENIEISDEKVEEEFTRLAEQYKIDVKEVKSYISVEALRTDLKVAEAAKIVKDSAKIEG